MKIAYIELGGSHMEIVYSFSHLLHKKGCEIHLICNEEAVKNLPLENIIDRIKIIPNHFKGFSQFNIYSDVKKYLVQNQIQHIILGTTEIRSIRNFSFYIKKFNTTGVIHNVEKLEKRWTSLRIGFHNINKFIVLGKHLLENVRPISNYDICDFVPRYYPEINSLNPIKPQSDFWIVVPGGVEQFRRDYVSFIQNLGKIKFPSNLKIIFLGSLWKEREQKICEALDGLKINRNNIITFNHFVDYNIFHSYLSQSNLILPLFKLDGTDWYNHKRISGAMPLGIAYKIPFLIPNTYVSHKDINQYSLFYNDYEELFNKIRSLMDDEINTKEIAKRYEGINSEIGEEANRLYDFIVK